MILWIFFWNIATFFPLVLEAVHYPVEDHFQAEIRMTPILHIVFFVLQMEPRHRRRDLPDIEKDQLKIASTVHRVVCRPLKMIDLMVFFPTKLYYS